MSDFTRLAEERIACAVEAGEFSDLPGAGRPLDLDEYFSAPESMRAGLGLLKSAGVVPPEIDLMREVSALRMKVDCATGGQRRALQTELAEKEVSLSLALERMRLARRGEGRV